MAISIKIALPIGVSLLMVCQTSVEGAKRTWTNSTGEFSVTAELLDFDKENVRLVKKDDTVVSVPRSRLSKKDQAYIADLAKRRDDAEVAFQQGVHALNSNLHEFAKRRLEQASKLDRMSIKSDFALGVMAMGLEHDVKMAAKHFEQCHDRWRHRERFLSSVEKVNYAAAHNNLALIRLRQKRERESLQLWKNALELVDETPQEIVQNLGTLTAFAVDARDVNLADIPISRFERNQLSELMLGTRLGKDTKPYQPGVGWLYMTYLREPPVDADSDEDRPGGPDEPGQERELKSIPVKPPTSIDHRTLRKVGSGTGFIVAPGYVITNKHVAMKDELRIPFDALRIYVGPTYDAPYEASVVSYSPDFDLAMLRTDADLGVSPISVYQDHPALGTQIVAVGFPKGEEFGLGLTVTSGSVSRHPVGGVLKTDPHREVKQALWHDAKVNSGNSGGPILTKGGVCVGVNFATFNPEDDLLKNLRFTEKYTLAVSSRETSRFIRSTIPSLPPHASLDGESSFEEVRNSIVYIELFVDALLAGIPRKPDASSADPDSTPMDPYKAFEDRWCMACVGTQRLPCPNRHCKNGVLTSQKNVVTSTVQIPGAGGNVPIHAAQVVTSTCPTCEGKSTINCRFSDDGIDRRFLTRSSPLSTTIFDR